MFSEGIEKDHWPEINLKLLNHERRVVSMWTVFRSWKGCREILAARMGYSISQINYKN